MANFAFSETTAESYKKKYKEFVRRQILQAESGWFIKYHSNQNLFLFNESPGLPKAKREGGELQEQRNRQRYLHFEG